MAGIVELEGVGPGFTDPVTDAQRVFRSVLEVMARPGSVADLGAVPVPPEPLGLGAAAICLALVDFETPLWIDSAVAASPEATSRLRFHCGCPIAADTRDARFALISKPEAMPALASFNLGSAPYPDQSTTLIVHVDDLVQGRGRRLSGPGIDGSCELGVAGVPQRLWDELRLNNACFPGGVDVILCAGTRIAALPRTTLVED